MNTLSADDEVNEFVPLLKDANNHNNNYKKHATMNSNGSNSSSHSSDSMTNLTHHSNLSNKGECSPPAKTDTTSTDLITSTDANNNNKNQNDKDVDYKTYSRGKQVLLFTIMLLVNVLGPLSTEAQVPALQDIAVDLNTTSQWVQLTITIYMLSFGASQLFFGTLSDMYGRRKTLIAGLVIYVLTNVGCALSPNIAALNIFRAIQAMGSGAGMVIVYAIARDVFKQDDRTRVLGILGGLRPIVIAASPVFGGSVTAFLGWRYIFWIIGGLSMALLIMVVLLLPETKDPTTVHITTPKDYVDTIKLLVRKRVFVGLVLISGAVYAGYLFFHHLFPQNRNVLMYLGVFIMFNEFSFVMENRYGFSEFNTGLLCGGIVFGLMIGSVISIGFVKCMDPITVVCIGIAQIFIAGLILVLPVLLYSATYPTLDGMDVWWSLIPLFLYVCADGLMLPHLISTALEPFAECAGTASALAGFWRFFSAAVIALIVSAVSSLHLPVLHLGTAGMGIAAGVLYLATLLGADSSEFVKTRKLEIANSNASERKALIDMNDAAQKYTTDVGVTVDTDSE